MYPNPIVLNDGSADKSYDFRGTNNEQSFYRDNSAPLDQPSTLTVKHSTTQVNTINQNRRTLIRLDDKVEDSNGNQGTLSAYVNLVVPEKVATSAQCTAILEKLRDFLNNTGNIARVVNQDL